MPRKCNRHDGWTPERQRAFIEALADCGSVRRAARLVNMSQANAYALRRAPGADEFRRAWEAALDFGLGRLKDLAFERAIEGELIPVFDSGKRTTINYFSSRASAGGGDAGGAAEASSTTVRTVTTGDGGDGGDGDGAARQDRRQRSKVLLA